MYKQKTYYAGETIEVEKTVSRECGKNIPRAKREKLTPEKVKKYNEKKSEDTLRRKVNVNFMDDDLHVVLPYLKNYRPSPVESKKILKSFLEYMRKECKKRGSIFKYIYVTGFYDKDGVGEVGYDKDHDETAIHHHLIINAIDYRVITKFWKKYGRAWFYPLDDDGDYTALSNYFIGHTKNLFREEESPSKKRWSCSRNLKEPKLKEKLIKASSWREEPVAKKGYKIITDSIRYGVSEITGYPYQFYRMVKIQKSRK